jgi:hypothetical protein
MTDQFRLEDFHRFKRQWPTGFFMVDSRTERKRNEPIRVSPWFVSSESDFAEFIRGATSSVPWAPARLPSEFGIKRVGAHAALLLCLIAVTGLLVHFIMPKARRPVSADSMGIVQVAKLGIVNVLAAKSVPVLDATVNNDDIKVVIDSVDVGNAFQWNLLARLVIRGEHAARIAGTLDNEMLQKIGGFGSRLYDCMGSHICDLNGGRSSKILYHRKCYLSLFNVRSGTKFLPIGKSNAEPRAITLNERGNAIIQGHLSILRRFRDGLFSVIGGTPQFPNRIRGFLSNLIGTSGESISRPCNCGSGGGLRFGCRNDPIGVGFTLTNFSKLVAHNPKLLEGGDRVGTEYSGGHHFKNVFPDWRLIGSAMLGISLMFWGWINVRTERQINWGLAAFLIGLSMWSYAVNGFLIWRYRI